MKELLMSIKRARAFYLEHRKMEKAKTRTDHIYGINNTVLYGHDLGRLLVYSLRAYRLQIYIDENAHRKTLPRDQVQAILSGRDKGSP